MGSNRDCLLQEKTVARREGRRAQSELESSKGTCGCFVTVGARSSTKLSTPYCDRSFDRVRPVGPAPTITTGALAALAAKRRHQAHIGPESWA